jgi:hypothetical protein
VEDLAAKRAGLDGYDLTLEALGKYLEKAVGTGSSDTGTPQPSAAQAIKDKVSECCQAAPPTDPSAPPPPPPEACAGFPCASGSSAVQAYDTAMDNSVDTARGAIAGCRATLAATRLEVDRAIAPPGPTDAEARALSARMDEVPQCVAAAGQEVRATVAKANRALAGCGGGADGPIPAPPPQ